MLEIENKSSEQFQMTITLYTDVRLSPVIYRDPPNWKQKFVANSNNNNFYRMSDWVLSYIETLKTENTSSEQFKMRITLYSDVLLSRVLYRDTPNWKWKLVANSNDNNFIQGCSIESRSISRRSKLKMEARRQFKRQ